MSKDKQIAALKAKIVLLMADIAYRDKLITELQQAYK